MGFFRTIFGGDCQVLAWKVHPVLAGESFQNYLFQGHFF